MYRKALAIIGSVNFIAKFAQPFCVFRVHPHKISIRSCQNLLACHSECVSKAFADIIEAVLHDVDSIHGMWRFFKHFHKPALTLQKIALSQIFIIIHESDDSG